MKTYQKIGDATKTVYTEIRKVSNEGLKPL